MSEDERLHGETPRMWLVDPVAGRLGLRFGGGMLRASVGLPTLFDTRLPSLTLNDVETVEILAPYAPPSSRLAAVLAGAAGAFALGGGGTFETGILMAMTTTAFALVVMLVSRSTPPRQRLARLTMADGATHCVAYRVEDEEAVRRGIGQAEWKRTGGDVARTGLREDEIVKLDQMRIGLVLAASALAILVLAFATGRPGLYDDDAVVPYAIVHQATWMIVIAVNAVAWWKMVAAKIAANRKGTRA